jgi:glycosyltransferase 2 family protein
VCAGLRWRQVMAPDASLSVRDAYEIVVISNLATVVAPSRAGDLAKAALVSRKRSIPVGRVLGAIVIERFADVVLLIVLAAGLWAFVPFPPIIRAGVTLFTITGVAAIASVFIAADWLPPLAGRIVGVVVPSWSVRVQEFLSGIFEGARSAGRLRRFPVTFSWTAANWALSAAAVWCNLRAMSISAPWYAALFVLLVVNLGGVIPASPGSIGVYHYLAVLALSVWMVDGGVALGFAAVAHAMGILVVTVAGLAGLASQHESLFKVTA